MRAAFYVLLAVVLSACGEVARLPFSAGTGVNPQLPEPANTVVPTVNIAPAKPWPQGTKPVAVQGLRVEPFASGLDHPRWVIVLPNGDVLVAESAAPERPAEGKGLKGWLMTLLMKKAGSVTPSADRITLLRDADGDGSAEFRSVLIEGLKSPIGMALIGNELYVANTDAVMRFPYSAGTTQIRDRGTQITDLPAGERNHHWTKSLIASPDGRKLYVTVGSNSNVAENGMQEETGRAAVWEVETRTGEKRIYASGLRNPNGMGWEPKTGKLWTVVNERDELGSDLVPDYLTSLQEGAFYGWPYSYYGAHVDERVQPPRPDLVAKAIKPDYALGAHVAPLGLAFASGKGLPDSFHEGVFVGQHGSWNRKPRSGYNVVFVPFKDGRPSGPPEEILGGFINAKDEANGRPVGVAIDRLGALLVADDVGNTIWRVTAAP